MSGARLLLAAALRALGPPVAAVLDAAAGVLEEADRPAVGAIDPDERVDRREAMARRLISGAAWDRAIANGALKVSRAGRRYVARVADVRAIGEMMPTGTLPVSLTSKPKPPGQDEEYQALVRGLRSRRATRPR